MESIEESSVSSEVTNSYEHELAQQREVIDRVDSQIIKLLHERTMAVLEVGRIKARNDIPIYVDSREKEVLEKVKVANEAINGVVPNDDIETIFKLIMRSSRGAQKRLHEQLQTQSLDDKLD